MQQRKRLKIKDAEPIILEILKKDSQARNDDNYLYSKVVEMVSPDLLLVPFIVAITDKRMPNYETVRRVRQRLQAKEPTIRAEANTEAARMLMEDEFKEYATHG